MPDLKIGTRVAGVKDGAAFTGTIERLKLGPSSQDRYGMHWGPVTHAGVVTDDLVLLPSSGRATDHLLIEGAGAVSALRVLDSPVMHLDLLFEPDLGTGPDGRPATIREELDSQLIAYPQLTAELLSWEGGTRQPTYRVAGPLDQLTTWLLTCYCEGDALEAVSLIGTAKAGA